MRSVRVLGLAVVACLCFGGQAVAKKVPYGGQNSYANGNVFTFGFVKTKGGVANFSFGFNCAAPHGITPASEFIPDGTRVTRKGRFTLDHTDADGTHVRIEGRFKGHAASGSVIAIASPPLGGSCGNIAGHFKVLSRRSS